ncbi:MAG: hypothetical protein M1839_006259 [Geoglossum umbratile]|nr:MAG: hypothetical protein M1839_006259 [Geoglossum umbratile]
MERAQPLLGAMPIKAPLERIPTELCDDIFGYLQLKDLAKLALTSRALYAAVQTPLYHRPQIKSYHALTLFVRTLNQVADYAVRRARWKWWKEDRPLSKDVSELGITIDAVQEGVRNRGQRPTAVLIGRLINTVVAHCPNINITLTLSRANCHLPPMTALEKEAFPRVTRVVLYLGQTRQGSSVLDGLELPASPLAPASTPNHSLLPTARGNPNTVTDRSTKLKFCQPNAPFWRSLFNGEAFPDCKSVEIHHFRATPPSQPGALAEISSYEIDWPHSYVYGGGQKVDNLGTLAGLGKVQTLILEFVPELDNSILMASLSRAANLKQLELRYCKLSQSALAKLLPHALPNLTSFTLLINTRSSSAEEVALLVNKSIEGDEATSDIPHLCPLIREFGKNLIHLEFANPYLCRELFVDKLEMRKIEESGVLRTDRFALSSVLSDFRKQTNDRRRKLRIAQAVAEAKAKARSTGSSSLFGGGRADEQRVGDLAREMERTLDDEEKTRTRLISGTKGGWDRRVVCWRGLCRTTDSWAEIEEEASLGEEGVKWTIANGNLKRASRHHRGEVRIDLDYGEEICGKPTAQLTPLETADV